MNEDLKSALHGKVKMENEAVGVDNSHESSGDVGEAARKVNALMYISAENPGKIEMPELIDLPSLDSIYPKA